MWSSEPLGSQAAGSQEFITALTSMELGPGSRTPPSCVQGISSESLKPRGGMAQNGRIQYAVYCIVY